MLHCLHLLLRRITPSLPLPELQLMLAAGPVRDTSLLGLLSLASVWKYLSHTHDCPDRHNTGPAQNAGGRLADQEA